MTPKEGRDFSNCFSQLQTVGRWPLRMVAVSPGTASKMDQLELGPNVGRDVLLEPYSASELTSVLALRKGPIKTLLLDQVLFAGIGNWVADEVLFHAGIAPQRTGASLQPSEIGRLAETILSIVEQAVAVNAESNQFPPDWLFHVRWGGKNGTAQIGGDAIVRESIGGRTTAWAPLGRAKITVMLFSALLLMAPPEPITIVNSTVAGIKTRAIVADMNDPRVRWGVVVATVFPGGDQDFKSMFTGSGAIAAINGTYFDKYNKRPIGDLVIGGRTVYEGRRGTAFTMTPDRQFKMFRVVRDRSYAWGSYESVIACGPALKTPSMAKSMLTPSLRASATRPFLARFVEWGWATRRPES